MKCRVVGTSGLSVSPGAQFHNKSRLVNEMWPQTLCEGPVSSLYSLLSQFTEELSDVGYAQFLGARVLLDAESA